MTYVYYCVNQYCKYRERIIEDVKRLPDVKKCPNCNGNMKKGFTKNIYYKPIYEKTKN